MHMLETIILKSFFMHDQVAPVRNCDIERTQESQDGPASLIRLYLTRQ